MDAISLVYRPYIARISHPGFRREDTARSESVNKRCYLFAYNLCFIYQLTESVSSNVMMESLNICCIGLSYINMADVGYGVCVCVCVSEGQKCTDTREV